MAQWPYGREPLACAHVPPTCLPPPRLPTPPAPAPPNSFRLSVQFYVQSLGRGRCKPRFISSPPRQEARAVHQPSWAQRNSGRGVAFRSRCLVGPGRRQPAPQNARWKGRPPQLHVLSSLRFLLSDLEPLSDAGRGPDLPQAISVLGCKPVAGPGTGKGQESHRRVCPHVTRGRETSGKEPAPSAQTSVKVPHTFGPRFLPQREFGQSWSASVSLHLFRWNDSAGRQLSRWPRSNHW